MNANYPVTYTDLLDLAPVHLPSYREVRYIGDNMGVHISDFAERDIHLIQHLYQTLSELLNILQRHHENFAASIPELKHFMHTLGWKTFLTDVRQLGEATYERGRTDMLGKVIHDMKGGSLMALSIYLQMLDMDLELPENAAHLFFLARDHLKMMRNAVRGLDAEAQERDRTGRPHSVQLLIEKWHRAVYRLHDAAATIIFDCRIGGNISERCLEFSALDRVIYNLINNAVRNTADNTVYFVILPVPEAHPHDARFVVYNRVREEQQRTLQARYNNSLGELFRGGFTTGGSGLGMRICADFINNAYGIPEFETGLHGGYFGAQLMGDYFVNWIHWPLAAD